MEQQTVGSIRFVHGLNTEGAHRPQGVAVAAAGTAGWLGGVELRLSVEGEADPPVPFDLPDGLPVAARLRCRVRADGALRMPERAPSVHWEWTGSRARLQAGPMSGELVALGQGEYAAETTAPTAGFGARSG